MPARVLIVAGSDSGGGAGIQADIKTVTALGGYAATAITALTAQNTIGVHGVLPIEPAFIQRQMRVVIDDIGLDCVKTGMLHSTEVIEAVAEVLDEIGDVPVVVDPVMVAKGGARLLEQEAVSTLKARLLPMAAVLTPNVPEAEALTGLAITDLDSMRQAGGALLRAGCRAVYLKGGHLPGPRVQDLVMTAESSSVLTGRRIETAQTHGTGCTLASAIATGLAQGLDLARAARRAQAYVHKAIAQAPGIGAGHGPVWHGHTVAAFD